MNERYRHTPALSVSPLEDRCLAAALAASVATTPAPMLATVPIQVVHLTGLDSWEVHVGDGSVTDAFKASAATTTRRSSAAGG
jgi:hypothetical protein